MRAVVTGGAGFIGGHLADLLLSRGWEVEVVDNMTSGGYRAPGATLHALSVRNAEVWWDVDAVFHLASPVGPVGVLDKAGRIVPEVVEDAVTVARWAVVNRCPLVYVSTSELYGPQTGACAEHLPRVTVPGYSARLEYAVAKMAAETLLLGTPGLDVRIVRPFNVAGPRQRPEGGFVLPRFVRQALAGEPLTVYGDGSAVRAFTHVSDIADGLLAVYLRGMPGGVYNLGNAANRTTVEDLARLVVEIVGRGSIAHVDPADLWGPGFREAADKWPDAALAERQTGWRASVPLRRIVEDVRDEVAGLPEAAA